MKTDVIIIGAGLSGLSAASLLAKRGLKVTVIEQSLEPGGACGVFKRGEAVFDKGVAMLYGFGEKGFNAHRFLFNCLEEPFEVIRHELLYTINLNGRRIRFFADIDRFVDELSEAFPNERKNIKRFYGDMLRMYEHVIASQPNYTTPDETEPKEGLKAILAHPISYIRFLSYMNLSAESLLKRYFTDEHIFNFFDKLTSTYCYATVREAPAILASVMFVDNHIGGSYYPIGSTLFLPGKLEKVIEEHGGTMIYGKKCSQIIFREDRVVGVSLENKEELYADEIIYSGTVWNLYKELLPKENAANAMRLWAENQEPTYPSMVFYALVDKQVIEPSTSAVEMLIGNKNSIDESEITVYISGLDHLGLSANGQLSVIAIGPSFRVWSDEKEEYIKQKQQETKRVIKRLEERVPGFESAVVYQELATPKTIERFTQKNNGAVAGPKQMLGQHMLKRQHIRTKWPSFFCCGESTVMGTGTPTVTLSGIAAANAVLKKRGLSAFVWGKGMKNYVDVKKAPFCGIPYEKHHSEEELLMMKKASRCRFCLKPSCCLCTQLDVRGIMRRTEVGNFAGAKKALEKTEKAYLNEAFISECESRCIAGKQGEAVEISAVSDFLLKWDKK